MTEPRVPVKDRKFRRNLLIAAVSGVALLSLVGAGVFGLVTHYGGAHKNPATATAASATTEGGKTDKVVKFVCSDSVYKERCESTLLQAANGTATSPKELVITAINAVQDELRAAFNKTSAFKFSTEVERQGFEQCEHLMELALDDLRRSLDMVGDATSPGAISDNSPDLNSWLSAVISHQETCIDGFPEGKLKSDMAKLFVSSREFTSNSLALVAAAASFLAAFQMPPRHLLEAEPKTPTPAPLPTLDHHGFPEWMEEEDRRSLRAREDRPKPNAVVAKDGSGQFKTINQALAARPANFVGRYVIYIKAGVYNEQIVVPRKVVNVTMYGDGSHKTIITGSKNFEIGGVKTSLTATLATEGDGFYGRSLCIRNTAGPQGHQAVALRVNSDRALFANCRFEGYQDTLYTQAYRQFYRSCLVSGTVDFIFGDGAAVLQTCEIVVRRPSENQFNAVTAQGRKDMKMDTGLVIHNCRIIADRSLEPVKAQFETYLGRPWKEYSRTVIMESVIGDLVHPAGWRAWAGNFALDTLYYAEYRNRGPGANTARRVNWRGYHKAISQAEAMKFTPEKMLRGRWIGEFRAVPIHYTLYGWK